MKMNKLLTTLLLGLLVSVQVQAADFPEKPVTAIVPFPPGGSTDSIARAIAPKFQQKLGQALIVDNRPGASGAIGAGLVKRSPADGYTILIASIAVYSVNPILQKTLPYDPSTDFDLLTVAVRAPNVLVVNPNFPANSVQELIAHMKKNPGKVSFATSGNGTSDHLTSALFWQKSGTNGLHVPYKGGAPAITDLIGGHADVSFQNINAVISHIKAGKLKALAITSDKRSPLLAQVPTLAEAGVKEVDVYSWQGIAAPKGLPKDVKAKLHGAIVGALQDQEVKRHLEDQGFEIVANSPEEFKKFQAQELARWRTVIETGRIELD